MKLILVDGNEANVTETVGVSVYTLELLHEFKKYATHDIRFCVYLRKPPQYHLPKENQYFRYKIVWGPFLWLKIFLPLQLAIDHLWQRMRLILDKRYVQFHCYFAPAHYAPPYLPPGCKLVVTIHDLAFKFFPDEFLKKDRYKLENWTAQAVQNARTIITVSEHTRRDVLDVYAIPETAVTVIHNGYTPVKLSSEKHTLLIGGHDYGIEPYKYVLYLGTLQPRKNITNLLYAFALFHKENPDYSLIIAGKKGWMYKEIFSLAQKLHLDTIVHFVGYVTAQEKNTLLSKALCMVFPSLYEGFGLPILEAFSAGCPVLCSNTSSLPEVAGRAALYFDPKNANDMLDKMRTIASDLKLRHTLVEAGELQLMKFSWGHCAKKTLEVLLSP